MGLSSENAVQHVAAGMILCLFEVKRFSIDKKAGVS